MKKHAFTLIELIVVITILAILGTIAFISFSGFNVDARNAVRSSDLNNINKGISLLYQKTGDYITPTGAKKLTIDGEDFGEYGTVGDTVLKSINIYGGGKDPLTGKEYYYSNTGTTFNVLGFFEGSDISFSDTAVAENLLDSEYKFYGNSSIYIAKSDMTPLTSNVGNTLSEDLVLISKDTKETLVSGTNMATRTKNSCVGIRDFGENKGSGKYEISINGTKEIVYCDMEVDGGGWTLLVTQLEPNYIPLADREHYKSEGVGIDVPRYSMMGNRDYFMRNGKFEFLYRDDNYGTDRWQVIEKTGVIEAFDGATDASSCKFTRNSGVSFRQNGNGYCIYYKSELTSYYFFSIPNNIGSRHSGIVATKEYDTSVPSLQIISGHWSDGKYWNDHASNRYSFWVR